MAAATRFILMMIIACFAFSPAFSSARTLSNEKYLQIKRQLNSLNKPAAKSFNVDGDIFDCVDIHKQPSFDHPLLKNFTIPTIPKLELGSLSDAALKIGLPDGGCPDGTVPIRRVQFRDLLRSRSSSSFGTRYHNWNKTSAQAGDSPSRSVSVRTKPGDFRGGQATFNVWNLSVSDSQYSTASLQVFHGYGVPGSNLGVIQAGWMVNKKAFSDSEPRLFAHWSEDNEHTKGCFNLECQGFVQVSPYVILGAKLFPTSSEFGGPQVDLKVVIYVANDGVWWLLVNNELVGFWPPSVFNNEMKSANVVQWGGDVFNGDLNKSFPPMGSGHFPREGEVMIASYIKELQVLNSQGKVEDAPAGDDVVRNNEAPACYGLTDHGNEGSWHRYFYFGGPGGKC
ncbi:protein neprosin-like [Aristolochia californica]|uniref:protein neprosin-like n=1 Tax=Aristolochia californica TaxID=171875 RepID=UPI0035E155E8